MKQLDSKYTFPTIDLLNSTNRIQTEDKTEVEELKERIIRILDNFNININKFSDFEILLYSFGCNIAYLTIIIACYYKTLKKLNIEQTSKLVTGIILIILALVVIFLSNTAFFLYVYH